MSELKNQVEKIDQECKSIRKSLENSIQKTHNELLKEMKLNNKALKKDLTLNLKEEIIEEVGSRLRQDIANLKQDLKDIFFKSLG
jgi:vacuolar-type H+-ATPase subunit E/Vma4